MAFPSISTGAYGFPLERATEIALKETARFLERDDSIEKVIFVCFGEKAFNIYKETFSRLFKD